MFDRHLESNDFLVVPLCNNLYKVNISGVILDEFGCIVPVTKNKEGNNVAWLYWYCGWAFYQVAQVVAHTFKRNAVPVRFWEKLSVLRVDECKGDHPSNLVWKFPQGLTCTAFPDHAFVPGYSRYVINREGELINLLLKRIIPHYTDTSGYEMYGVQPDFGKRTVIGRHRLMALAWLDYPVNVDRLDVNHINGIKGDDRLDNLEWATRKRNCSHAYKNDLRNDNHKVLVRNVLTQDIVEYYSYEECARSLGVNGETIRQRVLNKKQLVYPGNYQFKDADDPTPWREISDIASEFAGRNYTRPIKVLNIFTREEQQFNGISETARALGINNATVGWNINNKTTGRPVLGYLLKYYNDTTKWPEFNELELEFYRQHMERNMAVKGRGYVLTEIESGNKKVFAFIDDLCTYCDIKSKTVFQAIENKYKVRQKWLIEFLT